MQQQYQQERTKPKMIASIDRDEMEKKKAWLDNEVEMIIQRKRDVEAYEEVWIYKTIILCVFINIFHTAIFNNLGNSP